jgi:sugar phosphate isomerase/epimerase
MVVRSAAMRLGVVLEAFVDRTLDDTLELLASVAPQVTALEVGVGGFAPAPHCDAARLLRDDAARREWSSRIEGRGFVVSALNASGNPLDPDTAVARAHDEDLHNAVRLAAALGVDCVVAMTGCPAGTPGDRTAHFDAGGWLPYLAGVGDRQWHDVVGPYWEEMADFARREHPALTICVELHPGTAAHNSETFERFAAISDNLAANLDPSHLFWQRMDPLVVTSRLSRIGHAHAKDVVFNEDELAVNGLLDRRWSATDPGAPWTFATVGRGHDAEWWSSFLSLLTERGVGTISIEHEDPTVSAEEGIAASALVLASSVPMSSRQL